MLINISPLVELSFVVCGKRPSRIAVPRANALHPPASMFSLNPHHKAKLILVALSSAM